MKFTVIIENVEGGTIRYWVKAKTVKGAIEATRKDFKSDFDLDETDTEQMHVFYVFKGHLVDLIKD